MVRVPAAYKKAIQSLWTGLATVTVMQGVLNPANGRTEPVEKVTASGLVSYTASEAEVLL